VTFTSSAPWDRGVKLRTGAGPPDRRAYQVFVRDTEAGTTQLASRTPQGREENGASFHPAISDDGLVVAFVSSATDLVRTDKNRLDDPFRYDTASGPTTLVSRNSRGGSADGRSDWPALSSDAGGTAANTPAVMWTSASKSTMRKSAMVLARSGVLCPRAVRGTVVECSRGALCGRGAASTHRPLSALDPGPHELRSVTGPGQRRTTTKRVVSFLASWRDPSRRQTCLPVRGLAQRSPWMPCSAAAPHDCSR
jgi:hypothetical protein